MRKEGTAGEATGRRRSCLSEQQPALGRELWKVIWHWEEDAGHCPRNGAAGARGCARTGGGAMMELVRSCEKARDPTEFRGGGSLQGCESGALARGKQVVVSRGGLRPQQYPCSPGCRGSSHRVLGVRLLWLSQGLPGPSCPHLPLGPGQGVGSWETQKVLECEHKRQWAWAWLCQTFNSLCTLHPWACHLLGIVISIISQRGFLASTTDGILNPGLQTQVHKRTSR